MSSVVKALREKDEEIAMLRGALAMIFSSTELDAIRHQSYEHLASSICACAKAALDGQFVDDMRAAEVYDALQRGSNGATADRGTGESQ